MIKISNRCYIYTHRNNVVCILNGLEWKSNIDDNAVEIEVECEDDKLAVLVPEKLYNHILACNGEIIYVGSLYAKFPSLNMEAKFKLAM